MSTFHPATSSLANSRIQYWRSLRLDSSFTSAALIKTRTYVCHGITAQVLFTCQLHYSFAVKYTCYKPGHRGYGGVVNFSLRY